MKTLRICSTHAMIVCLKSPLFAWLIIVALAFGASGSAVASAPAPFIEAPRMSYQLENQSFDVIVWLPLENRVWAEGEDNSKFAWIKSGYWEVSTDNGSSWRKIDSVASDADVYSSGTHNPLTIKALKTGMSGWQYRANVDICHNNDQSVETRRTNSMTLNVRPSFIKCPVSLAFDSANNLYVADMLGNAIWKITPDNKASVFAGSATDQAGTLDASGTFARFNRPRGIAYQGGRLYVADCGNNAVRVVTLDGTVSTLAGYPGRAGDYLEGTGMGAYFNQPTALTVDSSGNVYVVDSGNNVIRKITPSGVTSHIAGIQYATDLGLSAGGSITITNAGNAGNLMAGGIGLTGTMSINLLPGLDSSGTLVLIDTSTTPLLTTGSLGSGVLTSGGVIIGGGGYFADLSLTGTNSYFFDDGRLISSGSSIQNPGIHNTGTGFRIEMESLETQPYYFHGALGITLSPDGQRLYVADSANDAIVAVSLADGLVDVLDFDITGVPSDSLAGQYMKPTSPAGLRFDKNHNLYFADAFSSRIVKVSAANPATNSAQVVAGLANWLWTLDSNLQTLYPNSFADGSAGEALFNIPSDIAIDATGNIYVADSENAAIRKITQSGTMVTVTTLMLQMASSDSDALPASDGSDSSDSGGGAPSTWYLLALGAFVTLRLRRR